MIGGHWKRTQENYKKKTSYMSLSRVTTITIRRKFLSLKKNINKSTTTNILLVILGFLNLKILENFEVEIFFEHF